MFKQNKQKGFSFIELVVIIAIIAILLMVLAPSLLSYTERSRAQKDETTMDEVVNAVQLAMSDSDCYDEMLLYSCDNNFITYTDSSGKYGQKIIDAEYWAPDGYGKATTITFNPEKDSNGNTVYRLENAIVNDMTSINGSVAEDRVWEGTSVENNVCLLQDAKLSESHDSGYLYNKIKATIGTDVITTSSTYANSSYTIFIRFAQKDRVTVADVSGSFNGTNLDTSSMASLGSGTNTEIVNPDTGDKEQGPATNPDGGTTMPDFTGSDLVGSGNTIDDGKPPISVKDPYEDLKKVEGSNMQFGRAYINTDIGMALLPFADGGVLVGNPFWGYCNADFMPEGTLTYVGNDVIFDGMAIATCNDDGTEAYYEGFTFTLEPVLLGTNYYCSHTITRSDAIHYVATYIRGATDTYTGDEICVYCGEIVNKGECSHKHTELQNLKNATCTEQGYTGDTFCKDCNKIVQYGSTITASHKIENGICVICGGWVVPQDGEYIATNGTIWKAGDVIPCSYVTVIGDRYSNKNYGYRYNQRYNSNWKDNPEQNGWGVVCSWRNVADPGSIMEQINKLPITNMDQTFKYNEALVVAPIIPSTVTSMRETFGGLTYGCPLMKTYAGSKDPDGDFSNYIIPDGVTDLYYGFTNCESMTKAPAMPASLVDMYYTFYCCSSLIVPPDMSRSTNVTRMTYTFASCRNLKTAPNLSNCTEITDMYLTFWFCDSMVNAPDISNCTKLTKLQSTFSNCSALTDLSDFVIPESVIGLYSAFADCESLQIAPIIPSTVTRSLEHAFDGCKSLTSITINATPTYYANCLKETQVTTILGDCTNKTQILKTK